MRKRRTARVLLFDPSGSILLIRCVSQRPDGEFVFWLTPGGEIEPGETELAAAQRELHEELGLTVPLEGPVRVHENQFRHQGELRQNTDFYFRASCERDAPRLAGITAFEIALMQQIRWWTPAELASAADRIYPLDLPAWLQSLPPVAVADRPRNPARIDF
jgi:8-oxo-dGTP diphosphatase